MGASMRRAARFSIIPAMFLFWLAACASTSPSHLAEAEAAIRARSRAVAEAEANKDAAAVMPYWTEDAVVHFNGEAPLRGKAAIGAMYRERLPRLETFRAETNSIEVAPAADMAWETGTTFVTLPSASGSPVASTSKFLIVWEKGADGQWQIAACALTANPKR